MSADSRSPSADGDGDEQTCLYCGLTSLQSVLKTKNVKQHSHYGDCIAITTCEDCGGAVLRRTQVNTWLTSSWCQRRATPNDASLMATVSSSAQSMDRSLSRAISPMMMNGAQRGLQMRNM